MRKQNISSSDHQIFLYKTLVFLVLIASGFTLGLAGFFYGWLAWTFTALFALALTSLALTHRVKLKPSRELTLAMLGSLVVVICFSLYATPTIFSGRDQGSISEAAIRLAQNHKFAFSTPASDAFFKIRGAGKALNFPGFYYTKSGQLITQFPLVYIVWLALFFSLCGPTGFIIANAVTFWFFLMAFYLLLRQFLPQKASLLTLLFTTTSFLFMWFFKYTLSENIALPLFWVAILTLVLFLNNLRKLYYLVFLAAALLLSFTRIEGYAFLPIAAVIIYINPEARQFVKKNSFNFFWLPIFIFAGFFMINFWIDQNFYRELVKAFLPKMAMPQAQLLGTNASNDLPSLFNLRLFYLYGMLGFFLLGALSIMIHIWKKELMKLLPFIITLPTFIYFFDSHITPDQPWMLRRFLFSLLPVTIFYTGLLLGKWLDNEATQTKKLKLLAIIISILLLANNLPSFLKYYTYSENANLLPQVQEFSKQFGKNDLILIDQQATKDGWSMITGPMSFLYEKNSAYFFNLQDLAKLDTNKFDNIYLVASDAQVPYYLNSTFSPRLSISSDYSFRVNHLEDNEKSVSFPLKKDVIATGKILKLTNN